MKKFNLFLAFLAVSTVAMASKAPAPAPASVPTLWAKAQGAANTAYDYTLGYVDAADKAIVGNINAYVVAPLKPVTDRVVAAATSAKNVTCNTVQYPFVHPLKTAVVAAAAYAIYSVYVEYNKVATKKSIN